MENHITGNQVFQESSDTSPHSITRFCATVFEETSRAFSHVQNLEKEIERINHELTVRTDYDSEEYMQLIERVSSLSEKFYGVEEINYDAAVEKMLIGLGFSRSDFNRMTSEFSGGWRMRIELAKLLLQDPDLILLDEPTNHLDIDSVEWFENFLINSAKAVVVISHDRAFVDNITNRTIEVTMGRIYDYKASYSQYLELRKERREQQQKQYDDQQKMIAETKEFIERFKGTYSKTLQVQSRVKMLEKLELIEVDEIDNSALKLRFPPSPRSGSYPVIAEDVSKSYDEKLIFSGVNLTIERGEKVAFVGRNGEGKSTLVKCIMGEIGFGGSLQLGHNVKIGYFAQNQASLLDEELTVFQTIDDIAVGDIRTKIRDILGAFMFGREDIDKKVRVLSGGERTRLAMIKLLLEPVNLLILDEPTNHLDLKTKDVLKQALIDFDGTLIVVSHDRDFLNGLVKKVYEFGNQKVTEHLEDIYGFLAKKKMDSLREIERK
jgi:ATP-binding cassette subfamily F protein 3